MVPTFGAALATMASKYAEKDTGAGRKKAHSDSDDSDEEYTLLYKANKFF